MPSPAIDHDLLIVGAGPAGAAAAITAAHCERSVLLIDREQFPRGLSCAGWTGPAGVRLCGELGLKPAAAGAVPFRGVTIHSWDLKRHASAPDKDMDGWIVRRETFDAALLELAAARGVQREHGVSPVAVELRETHVCLWLSDERSVSGRVLLIADGAMSPTARLAGLPSATSVPDRPQCLFGACPCDSGPAVDVAIGATRAGQLATIVRDGRMARLSLMTRNTAQTASQQFKAIWDSARQAGLLPAEPACEPTAREAPGGVALDLESHVGKRCLLIGDAGGFVSAFSHEGIFPAMKSGCVAATVADQALRSALVQDELANFESAWRTELADYMRLPNTDLALLMPLVFNNEQMSRRVARAFLLGRQF